MARALIEISTPHHNFGPVLRCIYCGRKSFNLTKEHVIPFGLAANSLVLRKASCAKCQKRTHEFETFCLRHMWWQFRTIMGIPTRKSRESPESFPMARLVATSFKDGEIESSQPRGAVDLPVSAYPLYYFCYSFQPPGLWTERPRANDVINPVMLVDRTAVDGLLAIGEGFKGGTSNPETFCKMLAKIGHSYGIAKLGWGAFSSPFGLWLRGKENLRFLRWIGSTEEAAGPTTALHEIELRVKSDGVARYVVVHLRLFACLPVPRYEIVVGKLGPSFNQFSLFEQPLHRIEVKSPLPIGNLSPAQDVAGVSQAELIQFFEKGPA